MKRLFVEEVIRTYDYSTKVEAEKHRDKMLDNGWCIRADDEDIHFIDEADYSYSITYTKLKEL